MKLLSDSSPLTTTNRASIDVRRTAAVLAGKLSASASRALGKGGGTALPGVVATCLDPDIVRDLSAQLAGGSILVSGTNGKTTTSRILGMLASDAGLRPLRNDAGSNLMRGVAASLVREASLTGNLAPHRPMLGLFEVDEAALPELLATTRPQLVVVLNLFRDQLDRYGEVATVARLWTEALVGLPPDATVVANADDPLVAEVAGHVQGRVIYYGIESVADGAQEREHARDVKACPRCSGQIAYTSSFFGHLGHFNCTSCDFRRTAPQVSAVNVRLHGVDGSQFQLVTPSGVQHVHFPLPGLYNVYNALAAAAAATILELDPERIARVLETITPAFGRMEKLEIDGRSAYLALSKNPTGLNEVLRTLLTDGDRLHVLVMLNDNIADGRDVSWIWDADVEMLRGRVASVVLSGTRAEDMALRFKYAGIIGGDHEPFWRIERAAEPALKSAVELTPPGERLFIVPTYTALLDVRTTLARLGYVKPYWEE